MNWKITTTETERSKQTNNQKIRTTTKINNKIYSCNVHNITQHIQHYRCDFSYAQMNQNAYKKYKQLQDFVSPQTGCNLITMKTIVTA